MSIRVCIDKVLAGYLQASVEKFTKHPLAQFIREEFRDAVAQASGIDEQLIFKGSAGQGVWARGPWVGVFNSLVTNSPQAGYYPVYLFREDMQGVYLSLNQGMTEAKNLYKTDAKTALQARASNFRAMLGKGTASFTELEIDLAPSTPSNDTAFYESGNICAKFYALDNLPSEAELVGDLSEMLRIYTTLVHTEIGNESANSVEGDEPPELHFEDASKFRLHKVIERNVSLSKKVKKVHGHTCQVCETNYESLYGILGKNYIEAHHLRPLASLKGQKVAMDPLRDFAVLCANCHRMIHRSGFVDDIAKFKKDHYFGQP